MLDLRVKKCGYEVAPVAAPAESHRCLADHDRGGGCQRIIGASKAFLLIAGLIGVLAVGLIHDVNGYAVGTVVLAVEAALVAVGRAAY